ncbi:MAG: ABC transporter substrate-binding protein [Nitrospirae bacterium]|nr:ABC transporter substrate-binding protein [Nitrospirota bacterium]
MKLFRLMISGFILVFLLNMQSGTLAADSPKTALQVTVDSIIALLKDKSLSSPEKKEVRREKIRALLNERFDFAEMAKRSLAKHWNDRTPQEQKEFVSIFSDLLQASYIGKIEKYTNEKVSYESEKIKGDGKYGVVETSIVTEKVDIPIEYKLLNNSGKWLVYDVTIEGVSFVNTYRSQYDETITRNSYAKLIEDMKTKLKEVKSSL